MAMVALMAGSVASLNFSSIFVWKVALVRGTPFFSALVMSAKLGSHGSKDITKVMAIVICLTASSTWTRHLSTMQCVVGKLSIMLVQKL